MDKKPVPISETSLERFKRFKEKYLDKKFLDKQTIVQIRRSFNLDRLMDSNRIFRVYCNEDHQHDYNCLEFYSPEAGIVERLIVEIERYQNILKEIHDKTLT